VDCRRPGKQGTDATSVKGGVPVKIELDVKDDERCKE
jgi:hypothetical protein